ncbi:MAG: aldose epimerase family protein [Saprospiraceae bacterium]
MQYNKTEFGQIDSKQVLLITCTSASGQYVQVTNYGGIIHAWHCLDHEGKLQDVLLGCKYLDGYLARHPYFGAIIGRYANRINLGRFDLNGQTYQLQKNHAPHHLHGGYEGFDKKIWDVDIFPEDDSIKISLTTQSSHMEEGYPGHLQVKVDITYNQNNELKFEYFATTDQDTHINLTNHCYFNLSGNPHSDVLDHEIMIEAKYITEANQEGIPTGKIIPVQDTAMDLTTFKRLCDIHFELHHEFDYTKGFDHNYIIDHQSGKSVAKALHRKSGRRLSIYTDQPGIQLYTGNWLGGVSGKHGIYQDFAGFCLETQHYPDSPNHPHFPSTLLSPGKSYQTYTIYKIDIKGDDI